jgi:hypothetical protein
MIKRVRSIWVDTKNAVVNADRTEFVFNDLPVIQVRGDICHLKVNSISGSSSSGSNDYINHTFVVKLGNVKYNHAYYFNSDKNSTPTICDVMIDGNKGFYLNNSVLTLPEQDINQLCLKIKTDDGHGLVKASHTIDLYFNIIIEEYDYEKIN